MFRLSNGANAVDTKMAFILSNSGSSFSAPRTKKIWLQRARPLVKELQALVWEPRPSALELERLLNAMVAYEDKDLGGQAQQHPSVIDELRVVRHVIKSNEGKVNKAITTASAAIKSIRERSTYSKYMRRQRSSSGGDSFACNGIEKGTQT